MLHYRISLVSTLYLNTCISILSNFCSTSLVNSWSCDNNSKDVLLILNKVSYCFVLLPMNNGCNVEQVYPKVHVGKQLLIYLPTFSDLLHEIFILSWSARSFEDDTNISDDFRRLLKASEDFLLRWVTLKGLFWPNLHSRSGNSPNKSQSQNMYH